MTREELKRNTPHPRDVKLISPERCIYCKCLMYRLGDIGGQRPNGYICKECKKKER